ncbi:hypothetical protein FJZ31_07280 [Candidatus Poribacteria bacterium]|nr:hypothetical protein [Candidatus Poribacteria bacterium]
MVPVYLYPTTAVGAAARPLMKSLLFTLLDIFQCFRAFQFPLVLVTHKTFEFQVFGFDDDALALTRAFDDGLQKLCLNAPRRYFLIVKVKEIIGTRCEAAPHFCNITETNPFPLPFLIVDLD